MRRSVVIVSIAGAFVLAFFLGYFPTLSRYREMKFQEEDMDQKIQDLDQKIKALSEERNLLKNDVDYLERVIRGELGLVKPGEIVYKFVEQPSQGPVSKNPVVLQAALDPVAESAAGLPVDSSKNVLPPEPAVPIPQAKRTPAKPKQ